MSRIERYNFILPETSIAHCIRCFIVDCSLYFSTICYVILSKSILQSFLPSHPPCGRAYRSEQDGLASRLRVQKYNKLPLPPNNPAEKFSKKFRHRDFDASIWQKSLISPIFRPSPLPPTLRPFLPRCTSKSHKTASELNPTNSEVVFSISEVEKIISEVNRTTSEVDQIISEEVIKSSRRWTKPPLSFNTKPKKQRSPTLSTFLAHACAHYAHTYTIIPRFLPSLPSPPTEKHLTTAWFPLRPLLFTSTLHYLPSPLPSPLFPWFSTPLPHRWRSEGNLHTLL